MHVEAAGTLNYGPGGIALILLALAGTTVVAGLVVAFLEGAHAGRRTAKFVFALGTFPAAGQILNGMALGVGVVALAGLWAGFFFASRRRQRSL